MAQRLAGIATAHPRRLGLFALLIFLVVAVVGSAAPGSFDVSHAFNDPASESTTARDRIEAASGQSAEPAVVALVDGGARQRQGRPRWRSGSKPTPASPRSPARPPARRWSRRTAKRSLIARDRPRPRPRKSDIAERLMDDFSGDPRGRTRRQRGRPGAGRRTGDERPGDGRAHRLPAADHPHLPLLPRGRGAPAAGGRGDHRARRLRRAARDQRGAGDLPLRAQPRDRHGPGAGGRLQPALGLPLPRGARPRRRPADGAGGDAPQRRPHRPLQRRSRWPRRSPASASSRSAS